MKKINKQLGTVHFDDETKLQGMNKLTREIQVKKKYNKTEKCYK